ELNVEISRAIADVASVSLRGSAVHRDAGVLAVIARAAGRERAGDGLEADELIRSKAGAVDGERSAGHRRAGAGRRGNTIDGGGDGADRAAAGEAQLFR